MKQILQHRYSLIISLIVLCFLPLPVFAGEKNASPTSTPSWLISPVDWQLDAPQIVEIEVEQLSRGRSSNDAFTFQMGSQIMQLITPQATASAAAAVSDTETLSVTQTSEESNNQPADVSTDTDEIPEATPTSARILSTPKPRKTLTVQPTAARKATFAAISSLPTITTNTSEPESLAENKQQTEPLSTETLNAVEAIISQHTPIAVAKIQTDEAIAAQAMSDTETISVTQASDESNTQPAEVSTATDEVPEANPTTERILSTLRPRKVSTVQPTAVRKPTFAGISSLPTSKTNTSEPESPAEDKQQTGPLSTETLNPVEASIRQHTPTVVAENQTDEAIVIQASNKSNNQSADVSTASNEVSEATPTSARILSTLSSRKTLTVQPTATRKPTFAGVSSLPTSITNTTEPESLTENNQQTEPLSTETLSPIEAIIRQHTLTALAKNQSDTIVETSVVTTENAIEAAPTINQVLSPTPFPTETLQPSGTEQSSASQGFKPSPLLKYFTAGFAGLILILVLGILLFSKKR